MDVDETVPERLLPSVESLREFRAAHPAETVTAAGETWSYFAGGEGPQLLVLPGASESAEMWFRHVSALEPDYRVILVDYPGVDSVEDLLAGVLAVLDAEYVESTDVVGYSLGGALAQALVSEYPDRVDDLVLSNATTPTGVPVDFFRGLTQTTALFPSRMLPPYARRGTGVGVDDDEAFWSDYGRVVDDLAGDRSLLTGPRCMVDFAIDHEFEGPPADWDGTATILEPDDDAVLDEDARAVLRTAFPDPRVVTVEGAGYTLPFVAREEFLAAVRGATGD